MGAFLLSFAAGLCAVILIWVVGTLFGERTNPMRRRILNAISPTGRMREPGRPALFTRSVTKFARTGVFDALMRLLLVKPANYVPGAPGPTHQLILLAVLLVAGFGSAMLASQRLAATHLNETLRVAATVAIGWLAMIMVAKLWLGWRAKRWLNQIKNGLINVLDLWVLCLSSGMSFQSALVRVTEEAELTNRALREQLVLTNQEILAGSPREDALRHLVVRCGELSDVRALVAQIIHAERLGGSLAQTLKVYASTLRFKRSQDTKEEIQRLPVKLTFPLILFILPALIALIAGPGFLRLYRALSSAT